jgi:hypothetical protein
MTVRKESVMRIIGTSIWSDDEVYEPCEACGRSERTIVGWWLGDTRHLVATGDEIEDVVERHVARRVILRERDACPECHYPDLANAVA